MKWMFLSIGILLLASPARAASGPGAIAATVNGEVITTAEVDRQVQSWSENLDSSLPLSARESRIREVRSEKLNVLITRDLILQAFYREKNKVPDGFVDRWLDATVKEYYGGDRGAFEKTLVERGMSLEKYKKDIADNYIIVYMGSHSADISAATLRKDAVIQIY